jgi:hypothetical protein
MAMRGRPLSAEMARAAVRVATESSIRRASKLLGLDRKTIQKYLRSSQGGQPAGRQGQPSAQAQGGASS